MNFFPGIDPELVDRATTVLRKLALISEGPASAAASQSPPVRNPKGTPNRKGAGRGKPESREPRGVNLAALDRRLPGSCPAKDESLLHFYVWQFQRARHDDRMRSLCFMAERDHAHRTKRQPMLPVPRETIVERNQRFCDDYPGVHVVEAAMLEGCSTELMRKAREWGGLDGVYGRPLEQRRAA